MNELLKNRIQDLKDKMTDYAIDFAENYCNRQSHTYLCDAICEFCDSNTSLYYSDIMNYIRDNPESVNEVINELGWDGCGCDIYKAGQAAEYADIERELYEDLDNIIKLMAFYTLYEYDQDVTDELVNAVDDIDCEGIDSGSRIYEIDDYVKGLFEGDEEDE